MCKDAGIPVVYINREPDIAGGREMGCRRHQHATYVGALQRQSGTYQGEEIPLGPLTKSDINGDGRK